MQNRVVLGSIILVGIGASIILGFFNGNLTLTRFDQYRDDAAFYNEKALLLLDQGSLRDDLSYFRKPPMYSMFLAASYGVLGRRPLSAWLSQAILYACSLILLYRISVFFISGIMAFIPALLYAVYWAASFYVFKIGSETLAIFLVLTIVYVALVFAKAPSKTKALLWGFLYALLTLTKPVVLYSLPISILILLVPFWGVGSRKNNAIYILIILLVYVLFVGGWMIRNQYYFNDYQIEQAGHVVWVKAEMAEVSLQDMGAYGVAAIFGDYIADKISPGYAANPVPLVINRMAKRVWADKEAENMSEFDINAYFLKEGSDNLNRRVGGAILSSFPSIFELNAPTNHRGFSLAHFLTGTHEEIPGWLKIILILCVRILWLVALGVVVWGLVVAVSSDHRAWFMAWMIIYFNAVHAFVIIPAETRYIAPVLPFYILFGVYVFLQKRYLRKVA